jgi:hypothetical protein
MWHKQECDKNGHDYKGGLLYQCWAGIKKNYQCLISIRKEVRTNQGFKSMLTLNILGYHQGQDLKESHLIVLNDLKIIHLKILYFNLIPCQGINEYQGQGFN